MAHHLSTLLVIIYKWKLLLNSFISTLTAFPTSNPRSNLVIFLEIVVLRYLYYLRTFVRMVLYREQNFTILHWERFSRLFAR